MNVKKYVGALLCLYFCLSIHYHLPAQALKVGDALLPALWRVPLQAANHPEGKATLTLQEYKDQLIILDFWATWCSPCIAMMPRLDSLQKQFDGRVRIIPVTYQSRQEVTSFMEKLSRRTGRPVNRPEVVEDEVLQKAFPRDAIPYYVWIGPDQLVKAITTSEQMTAKHISDFLQNHTTPQTRERPPTIHYDARYPLLVKASVDQHPVTPYYQSVLAAYMPGLGGGYQRQPAGKGFTRITMMNQTIPKLAAQAYEEARIWFGKNRILIETPDTLQLIPQGDRQEWLQKNAFCYEIIVPTADTSRIFQFMQSDLGRYFPQYQFSIQERDTRCYALTVTDRTALPFNQSGQAPLFEAQMLGLKMINCHPTVLVNRLNFLYQQNSPFPLVDETGITKGIDLPIEAALSDLNALNKALEKYGLAFREKTVPLKLLIINSASDRLSPHP
ncbi:TlpA disulfide reductase family protein [Emticicia sp. 21SJ11W-3]|uniref:TlpA family protein disulfide reductase n=1 Tax=Emticicia sp. 21SJ11W-3 TaxID=2916755 RepID=UPI0020A0C62B|nr:TlpA disulfide reductase family protein [Emticicia sp. 21SJ11W-3]UTA67276.1 TlpA family protein disulfide reductase [Emticicia sp. 21SJ11W-3]